MAYFVLLERSIWFQNIAHSSDKQTSLQDGQGAVASWIARLALETESVGSNPGHGKVVFWAFFFFFFLLTSLSLTCTGIILDHKVTRFGRDKERKKTLFRALKIGQCKQV